MYFFEFNTNIIQSITPTTVRNLYITIMSNDTRMSSGLFGCFALFLAIISAVLVGVTWGVILTGNDVCVGGMHTFVKTLGICYTVQLAVYGFGSILGCVGILSSSIAAVALVWNGVFMTVALILSSVLNLALFIWGVILLASHTCEGTNYYTFTIVAVVFSGLGVLTGCRGSSTKKTLDNLNV